MGRGKWVQAVIPLTLFKEVPKTAIEDYVQFGLEERNGTFQLVIPRQRKTEIFLTLPTRLPRAIRTIQGDLTLCG